MCLAALVWNHRRKLLIIFYSILDELIEWWAGNTGKVSATPLLMCQGWFYRLLLSMLNLKTNKTALDLGALEKKSPEILK